MQQQRRSAAAAENSLQRRRRFSSTETEFPQQSPSLLSSRERFDSPHSATLLSAQLAPRILLQCVPDVGGERCLLSRPPTGGNQVKYLQKKQRSKIIFDKPEIFFVQDYGRTKFHIVSSA